MSDDGDVIDYDEWKKKRAKEGKRRLSEAPPPEITRSVLDGLGDMSPVEYGQRREELADKLAVPRTYLDDEYKERRKTAKSGGGGGDFFCAIDPWPDEVDGCKLLLELEAALKSHLVLPYGAAEAIALWVLFTHAFDSFEIAPILAATSPTSECGKTTLLTILGALVARPLPGSNMTSAVVYRAVDKWSPTLLVDEADTFLRGNDELRGILNCGHNRRGAYVLRTVGDNHEPKQFSTWAPKAVAMIGRLPPTLFGRSIRIELQRKKADETVEPLRQDRLAHLEPLQRKAARWAADNADALKAADPEVPTTLYSRAADNWRPLLAIADLAGGEWSGRARRVAEVLAASESDETMGILLLSDLRDIFDSRKAEALHSDDILVELWEMEERPWNEWGRNRKPLTKNQLATLLKPFHVTPKQAKLGGTNKRGYFRDALAPLFERYLYPPKGVVSEVQGATPLPPSENKPLQAEQGATEGQSSSTSNHPELARNQGRYQGSTLEGQKEAQGVYVDPFASFKDPNWALQPRKPDPVR
jgi:putative DNA primase/helicase